MTKIPSLLALLALLAVLSVGVLGAGAPADRPAGRIGYVSVTRLLTESSDAKTWAAKIEAMRQERQRDLMTLEKTLQQTRVALAQSGGIFGASKRAALQEQEARQRTELERASRQAQADVQGLQREMQETLRAQWDTALDELGKQRGLEMVVNQDSTVVWSRDRQDLTDLVLKRLNAPGGLSGK